MKKAMTISALLSGIIHVGFFLGYEIAGRNETPSAAPVYEEIALVDEAPAAPILPAAAEDTPMDEEVILPDSLLGAGLAEPVAASVTADMLTQGVIPYSGHIRRPETLLAVSIPHGARGMGGSKAQDCLVFQPEELDHLPRLRKGARPNYPRQMLAAHIEGIVRMLVLLDYRGRVTVNKVINADRVEFEASAIEAAESFVYDPPTRNGRPVNTEFVLPIRFSIE
jgi:protein TonB